MAGIREQQRQWQENFGDLTKQPITGSGGGGGGGSGTSSGMGGGIFNDILDLIQGDQNAELERILNSSREPSHTSLDDLDQGERFLEERQDREQGIPGVDAVSRAAPQYNPSQRYREQMRNRRN